jgi:uncharacterized membrane protein
VSTSAISSQNFTDYSSIQNMQIRNQQMQQEFQQLGQDLQSGSLSGAKADVSALQQLNAPSSSTSATPTTINNNPVTNQLTQLSQALQSGSLSNAQQDYRNIQQNLQTQTGDRQAHHSHRHTNGGVGGGGSSSSTTELNQLFQQLGQELQSGTLSTAQQTYASLQQDFPLLGQSTNALSGQASPLSSAISEIA